MSGTLQASVVKDSASATNNLALDASGNVTVGNNLTVNSTFAMGSSFLRNRIINGNMTIDQRNAGAQITAANLTTGSYMVDRWVYTSSQAAKFTAQQNAGAVTSAVGFPNYLGMTVASAVAVGASDYFAIAQSIEGFNFADLAWGTANAKTITLSFQVYSSLTGTFGGALINSAANRSYPFSYTVSSANTWTSISVTIAGDTIGTWVGSTNGIGVTVRFGLGAGSTFSGTAGAWAAGNYISPTGAVSVVGTPSATFYITGVQLEVGTVATPFERRQYGNELALCQRYLPVLNTNSAVSGYAVSTTLAFVTVPFAVTSRVAPTGIATPSFSGSLYNSAGSALTVTSTSFVAGGTSSGFINASVASGLTAGNGTLLFSTAIQFTGCEL